MSEPQRTPLSLEEQHLCSGSSPSLSQTGPSPPPMLETHFGCLDLRSLLGSRVLGCVFVWFGVFLPAGGVEQSMLATAGAAGWRTCWQSSSGTRFKDSAPVYQCRRVLVFPNVRADSCFLVIACVRCVDTLLPARSRSPLHPAGLENTQDLTPVLAPHWSSPRPED